MRAIHNTNGTELITSRFSVYISFLQSLHIGDDYSWEFGAIAKQLDFEHFNDTVLNFESNVLKLHLLHYLMDLVRTHVILSSGALLL